MSLYDDLMRAAIGISPDNECMTLTTQAMRPWDANIDDVIDNWKPTNFYTIEQFKQILLLTGDTISIAGKAISEARAIQQLAGHREMLEKADANLRDELINPTKFLDGLRAAQAQQATTSQQVIIESAGLKRYVVNVLKAARVAKLTTTFVSCARPALLFNILSALGRAAEAVISFVKSVVGAVKTAANVVLKIPDIFSTFITVLKWVPAVALLAGGYYVATKTVLPPKYDPLKLRERETFAPWRRKGE